MSTKADPAAFMTGLPHWKHKGGPLKRAWTARNPCFYMGFYMGFYIYINIYVYFYIYIHIYIYIFLMKWKWSGVIFPNVGFLVPFKVATMSRLIHIAWAWSVSAVIFLPAHRPVGFQRSFEALASVNSEWLDWQFSPLFFFTEGHLAAGISPWSVCLMLIPPHSLCLCYRRAPSRLKLWEEGYSKAGTG